MATFQDERVVYEVDQVTVRFDPPVAGISNDSTCSVIIFQSQLKVVAQPPHINYIIPFRCMKELEIHQPIFGANYITGEYVTKGNCTKFTLTFSRGGATEFARVFFRLTEGHLVTEEPEHHGNQDATPTAPPPEPAEDKKNQ